jgi:hypothetical protein
MHERKKAQSAAGTHTQRKPKTKKTAQSSAGAHTHKENKKKDTATLTHRN